MKEEKIKDILIGGNYVTAEDIKKAEEYAKNYHTSISDYLVGKKIISRDIIGQAIAEFFKVPYADLNSYQPSREQVLKIPENIAKDYRVVIFKEDKKSVSTTTDEPARENLLGELKKIFGGKKITISFSLPEDINAMFVYYRKALETRFAEIVKKQKKVAPEIIGQIFEDALAYHCSDIHFDPQEKEVVVRFRIDGVLHEAGRILKEYYENILNRIKVQARLRLDEHFAAQDGAIRYKTDTGMVDMRVSIAPIIDGEKIVIRVLSEYIHSLSLVDLGLSPQDEKTIERAINKPFGMILVTGPTGSGKTTTLYALLKILNQSDMNVTTIEDPVEYKIIGANQIQVNPQTNLTFARGLRSLVRQDPDIILVGEIRDQETAEIAVNAALTGHLLLSTFHANDAATGIPRLLDMGVEPFLLSSTLELIFAQRLVRRLCESCRYSKSFSREEMKKLFPEAVDYFPERTVTLYQSKGCESCSNTGYRGRTAIFELIDITPELRELILKNPSSREIWELAKKQGRNSLFEDGLQKVRNGLTTVEELFRVASPPES